MNTSGKQRRLAGWTGQEDERFTMPIDEDAIVGGDRRTIRQLATQDFVDAAQFRGPREIFEAEDETPPAKGA